MSRYYNRPIAPVNYDPTRLRSAFAVHVFITAPTASGPRILDATIGPHVGTQTLETYLGITIDRSKSWQIYVIFNHE
jgi:hypothetical protein